MGVGYIITKCFGIVGAGVVNDAKKLLQIEIQIDHDLGQILHQLWIRSNRRVLDDIDRFDQCQTHRLLPHPVCNHFGKPRIVRIGHPSRICFACVDRLGTGDHVDILLVDLLLFLARSWFRRIDNRFAFEHRFGFDDIELFAITAEEVFRQTRQSCSIAADTVGHRLNNFSYDRTKPLINLASQFCNLCTVFRIRRLKSVSHATGERDHFKILSLCPFVIRMVVTLRTLQTGAQENPHRIGHVVFGHSDVAKIIANLAVILSHHRTFTGQQLTNHLIVRLVRFE